MADNISDQNDYLESLFALPMWNRAYRELYPDRPDLPATEVRGMLANPLSRELHQKYPGPLTNKGIYAKVKEDMGLGPYQIDVAPSTDLGGDTGRFVPKDRKIYYNPEQTEQEQLKTLIHELMHARDAANLKQTLSDPEARSQHFNDIQSTSAYFPIWFAEHGDTLGSGPYRVSPEVWNKHK